MGVRVIDNGPLRRLSSNAKGLLRALWADENGAELAEWVVVTAFVVASAIVVYSQVLQSDLLQLIAATGNRILGIIPGGSGGT